MNELLTTFEMAEADRLAVAGGMTSLALMERAGRTVADVAGSMATTGQAIAVLCGPGNNGGDGFVAARILAGRGYRVSVYLAADRTHVSGDARMALDLWAGEIAMPEDFVADAADLVIDALFGAGLSRPLEGAAAALVAKVNAATTPVLAVDVPSGLDGNTGQVLSHAIRATRTITFFRLKPGHLLYPGRRVCGETTVADIGISPSVLATIRPRFAINSPDIWGKILHQPDEEGHKYQRGHLLVLSGGLESTGAARLAAHAAARTGAGLVTVASPSDALVVNATALTDIMVRGSDGAQGLARLLDDKRRNAVVLGPGSGVGQMLRDCVRLVASAQRALVLDADALTSFAADAVELRAMFTPDHASKVVITPHDGEFSRLFENQADIVAHPDRLGRALAAARFLGVVVVLKGPDCVIASPDGRAVINQNGTPWLATAGSGDVLAGAIGGLLAQGASAFDAAAAGVWLHAEAGKVAGPGLLAHDLPHALRTVMVRHFVQGM